MKSIKIIEILESEIIELKNRNHTTIQIDELLTRIRIMKADIIIDQEADVNIEIVRSVISYGQLALKSAILINGGAAVAMLTFIGNKGTAPASAKFLACAIQLFSWGVLAAATAVGATYLCQSFSFQNNHNRYKKALYAVCALIGIAYFCFAFGVLEAGKAFVIQAK